MRKTLVLLLLISLLAGRGAISGQEPVAKSKIVAVEVFSNGLAIVKRDVQAPGAGTYRLDAAPEPVHGTFWIASNCRVETTLKIRELDVPMFAGAGGGLQEELAGKEVVIHWKDGKLPNAVAARPEAAGTVATIGSARTHGFLILKLASGYAYVNPSEIAYVEVKGKENTVKQQRPVVVLTVDKADKKPVITLSYLTQGLGWAPSYLVDIAGPKTLTIEIAATLRNELADLQDTEIKLMTGFPSVQFAHVNSPLAARTSWEKFLTAMAADPPANRNLAAVRAGESVEMHAESIGKRSLKEGETLSLSLARSKVDFERVVEWTVSSDEDETIAEELWDVLQFKNPFTFPMTTAPALVTEKGQFNGQRTCARAKVGEESSLRIARSLSVRTRGQEREEATQKDAKPEIVRLGSREYRRATVQGEMTVTNQRKQPLAMVIRRALVGNILGTEGNPKLQPRLEGLGEINASHEIVWTVNLAPGAEKTVRYRYNVLFRDLKRTQAAKW